MSDLPPLRAVGGNVLLRRMAMDVHRASLLILGGSYGVLGMGDVVAAFRTRLRRRHPVAA